jgi:DNA integrity scanning protein DisA with diadenylate cyclase activity
MGAQGFFMWNNQLPFWASAKVAAEGIFNKLDENLRPNICLIGISVENNHTTRTVCLEPENCGYDLSLFHKLREQTKNIYDQISPQIDYKKPFENQLYTLQGRMQSALQDILDNMDKDNIIVSFCSIPRLIEGTYLVSVVLQFKRDVFNSYYSLKHKHSYSGFTIETSLLNATVTAFLSECSEEMLKPDPGLGALSRSHEEIIRTAGHNLMFTPALAGGNRRGVPALFHSCNTISSMRHEGTESVGRIIIARQEHPNVEVTSAFSSPVARDDHRTVRKLLETSSKEIGLLTDSANIYGLGKIIGSYDQEREDLFIVKFTKHYTWELLHYDQTMMRVSYGLPELPRPLIEKKLFFGTIKNVFANIKTEQIEKLWELTHEAIKQRKGTIVVVVNDAQDEAIRLERQAFRIEPITLTTELIKTFSAIDGAVLIDPEANCYAIGVILDGQASERETRARGARYNSATRYVYTKQGRFAIVVSEDGSIDLIPPTSKVDSIS